MSNQPIALGGPAPIALGGGPIALGPTDPNENKPANAQQNGASEANGDQEEPKKPKQDYTWADEWNTFYMASLKNERENHDGENVLI